ncbi:MAG TPA: peptide chain release factor N(5)-glutamine methyltransferase, partial [Acidimicrobiia bacterium]|nr:peptide chain release factor N(5)-glutamine methyltransferase [Acidimicrobiia bacterium]
TPERPLQELVAMRSRGHPLQYLEGTAAFGPLVVAVDDRVLIPRPETEHLADLLAHRHPQPELVVDLCTGSGAVALFLKSAWPQSRVVATDFSVDALAVARQNAERLGLDVEWYSGDLFRALPARLRGRVELLVANPPYVSEDEWDLLPDDVKHEPRSALVAGAIGTEIIDRILDGVGDWLAPGSEAWIEIGETQGPYLRSHHRVQIHQDQYGKDRFAMVTID